MRTRTQVVMRFLIAWNVGVLSLNAAENIRVWTSTSGATVEARFERMENGRAVLKKADGSEIGIGLEHLSADDKALIQKQEIRQPKPVLRKPNELPVLKDDRWKGAHAVYEHVNFDAVMGRTGKIYIYPKDQGQRIAKPLTLNMDLYHAPPHHSISVREYTSFGDPIIQPKEVVLKGVARHESIDRDVEFEVIYTFSGNKITGRGSCKADPKLDPVEKFRIIFGVPNTHLIKPEVEQQQRIELLKDYFLLLKGGSLGNRTMDYYSVANLGGTVEQAELVGPLWNPRRIIITAPSKKAPLYPYIYTGKSLWEGFLFQFIKEKADSKSSSQKIVLTIQ